MKQSVEITILDLEKPNSYTDRGRYVVCINGQRQLSANSEIDALKKTLAMVFQYKEEYQKKYYELCKLCSPIANFIKPDEEETE